VNYRQVEITDWPSRDCRAIAVLRLEPEELAARLHLSFRDGEDDLDALKHAGVRLRSGEQFLLLRHAHAPKPGTDLYADAGADAAALLDRFLLATGLATKDVTWRAPDATPRAQPR
jgi:hypothetical protein